jgi:hypothetical protein
VISFDKQFACELGSRPWYLMGPALEVAANAQTVPAMPHSEESRKLTCSYVALAWSHYTFYTPLYMAEVLQTKKNSLPVISIQNIFSCHHINFEKISGDTGDISAKWGANKSVKVQRITRTLDAFQHYVVAKSHEELLIADLQGKLYSLINSS